MLNAHIEIDCQSDAQLQVWWTIINDPRYLVAYNRGCIEVTGKNLSQSEFEELSGFAEKYPIYSVFLEEKSEGVEK